MSHKLIVRDGVASMAYIGVTPWHGLGQKLQQGADIDTWAVQAGFAWEALTAPVQFQTGDGLRVCDDKKVIYRSDTGESLSVMGDGYRIVQPMECLEFFRDLTEEGGWHLHTAGVLRGGRTLWAMASPDVDSQVCVVPNDAIRPHLLLSTSLDGTKPTQAGLTAERVVCANTLGFALRAGLSGVKGKGKGASVSHRSVFDAAAVKGEIGVAIERFEAFKVQAVGLAEKQVTMELAREILRKIFGQPLQIKKVSGKDGFSAFMNSVLKGSDGYKEQKSVARCLALFAGEGMGSEVEGVRDTAWGLLNAVTQHVDHEQGRTAENRFDSAQYGRGAEFKNKALELVGAM